jgi:hypothetical protein
VHESYKSFMKRSFGGSLGWIVLGACGLALDYRDEVVVATMLVIILLLFDQDLLPLALRGVEGRRDRFLTVCVVGRDVEDFSSSSGSPPPYMVDEGGAGGIILKRRDGVIVCGTGELGDALGEEPDVVVQALTRLLFAVAQLPVLVGAGVRALDVADEGST